MMHATLAVVLFLAAAAPSNANAAQSEARVRYEEAVARHDRLVALSNAVQELRNREVGLRNRYQAIRRTIESTHRFLEGSESSLEAGTSCAVALQREIRGVDEVVSDLRSAMSAARLSVVSQFDGLREKQRLDPDLAFAERRRLVLTARTRLAEIERTEKGCSGELESAGEKVLEVQANEDDLRSQIAALVDGADRIQEIRRALGPSAFVNEKTLRNRALQSIDGPALADLLPTTGRLRGMLGLEFARRKGSVGLVGNARAFVDAAFEVAALEDAREFAGLTRSAVLAACDAEECLNSLGPLEEAREAAWAALRGFERARVNLLARATHTPGLSPFASPDPKEWADALVVAESAVDRAGPQIESFLRLCELSRGVLEEELARVTEAANDERKLAFRRLFGVEEPQVFPPPAPPPPPPAPPKLGAVTEHAYQVFFPRGGEEDCFLKSPEVPCWGAYTYVLVKDFGGLSSGGRSEEEVAKFLAAVVADISGAGSVKPALRPLTNLFLIPGTPCRPSPEVSLEACEGARQRKESAADPGNYSPELARSKMFNAGSGVFAGRRDFLLRWKRSRGPFLLTLPVPIDFASSGTSMLFADLGDYSADTFGDLVRDYRAQVELAPTDPEWAPKLITRLALGVVNIKEQIRFRPLVSQIYAVLSIRDPR